MPRALAVAFLSLSACGAPEPLRLGVSLRDQGIAAARMAAAEINASGGIHGRFIELRVAIDGEATLAQPAIAAADSFARDTSVLAVVGHSNSSSSLAASQVYNARHLPQIAPTTTASLFTQAGPFSFRLVPDDRGQAKFLARQAISGARRSTVAVVYLNNDYGRSLHGALQGELKELGVEVVYEAPFLEGDAPNQFGGALAALSRSSPDLLFWLGRPIELAPLMALLRIALPDLTIVGSDGLDTPEIDTDPSFIGIRFVRFIDPQSGAVRLERFREAYRREVGMPLTSEAVLGYDAVLLLADALRAGASSRERIRNYLDSLGRSRPPFDGIAGPISFDQNGDVARPYHLAIVTPGGARALRSE